MEWDLQRLRILYELQRKGTMSAVAETLNYSPSAISQQLSALTSEVGAPLLEPDGRRVRLTPQAEILVHHAARIFEILDEAEAEFAASRGEVAGTIRLASLQTVTLACLPRALTWLGGNYPLLRVETTQAEPQESIRGLLSREYDVAIVETYSGQDLRRSESIDEQLLFEECMRVAVPDDSAARRVTELADLRTASWVAEPAGSPARRWSEQLCRQAGFKPDVLFESDDMLAHVRLVEAGHAVALLPDLLWSQVQPSMTLVHLPELTPRRISMCMRRGFPEHPTVQVLYEALQVAVAEARREQTARLAAAME